MVMISLWVMANRSPGEGFSSIWSSLMMVLLSVGGTMIMRRFHNSMAVGFFMGSIVASSQMYFLLFLLFISYASDRALWEKESRKEHLMTVLCFFQAMLLFIFALILGAHRTQILDRPDLKDGNIELHSKSKARGSKREGESEKYAPPIV